MRVALSEWKVSFDRYRNKANIASVLDVLNFVVAFHERQESVSKQSTTVSISSMLTDEPAVRKALLLMVVRLEENFRAREDLLQEALICLLTRERQHPGQRLSWYLQGVNFYWFP